MSRKRKKTEAFSLFAFQDIITSVTGIIILITLFLAIELMERTENTPETQTVDRTKQTEKTVEELNQEIAKYKQILESSVQGISQLPSTDPDTLKRMVDEYKKKMKYLDGKIANNTDKRNQKRREADGLTGEQQAASSKGDEEKRRLAAEIAELEKKLRTLGSSRLIFNEGTLAKNTWIVEVSKNGFRCAPIGVSSVPKSITSQAGLLSWARSNSGYHLFFCVKPNGISKFNSLKKLLPSNIKFGYRPVGLGQRVLDDKTGAGI